MAKKAKKPNRQDATLRNNRARQGEIATLRKRLDALASDVATLRDQVFALQIKGGSNG